MHGPGLPATPATPVPTSALTQVIPTPSVAPSAAPVSSVNVPFPAPTARLVYSSDEIDRHFIDVAFSADNSNIRRFGNQLRTVAITGSYKDSDVAALNRFFLVFNNNSFNTRLPSEVK